MSINKNTASRVAAIQMCSTANVTANLAVAAELISEAASLGATLAVLPEMFPLLTPNENDKLAIAEPFGTGLIQDFLAHNAKRHRLWIVAGTIPLQCQDPNKIRAACLLYQPDGSVALRYDKIHLFDALVGAQPYQESNSTEPGDSYAVLNTPMGTLGLSVCYDLRFAHFYQHMRLNNAQIFINSAAFTHATGQVHWELLLRARAIENQCYMIASNQWGTHAPGRSSFGHSMIIDPWGKILSVLPSGDGVVIADLDLAYLDEIRLKMPMRWCKLDNI